MSAIFTWSIQWMSASTTEINGHSEVVLSAGWCCNGVQDANSASNYGAASFPQPAEGGAFTLYADLTQEQVLGWCWSSGVKKDANEANVQLAIDNQINPPVINPPLPWAAAPAA